jgi:hypothetical protein
MTAGELRALLGRADDAYPLLFRQLSGDGYTKLEVGAIVFDPTQAVFVLKEQTGP